MALQLVITNAGRAAVINQAEGGFRAVRIAAVGVSPTAVAAAPAATTLPGEVKRIASIAGEATAADVVHLTVTDESDATYAVRSFALYLSDGTLFALYGQADPIVEKSAQALLLLAIDITLAEIPAAAITFGNANFTNPAATTARAGVVELATDAEAVALADRLRALTPANMAAIFTASAILSRLLAVDGSGSGLDADLLDGRHAAEFALLTGAAFTGGVTARGFYADNQCYLTVPAAGLADVSFDAGDVLRFSRGDNRYDFLVGAASAMSVSAAGVSISGVLLRQNNAVWDAGNDGAGSGMDADLLDGRQAAEFALLSGAAFTGPVAAPALFADANCYLRVPVAGIADLGFDDGDVLRYTRGENRYDFLVNAASIMSISALGVNIAGSFFRQSNRVWDAGNDGAGSGLDADLLDGRQAADFALLSGAAFSGAITAPALFADANCYLRVPAAGLADVGFDDGDVLRFSRADNRYDFLVAAASAMSVSAVGVSIAGVLLRQNNRVWDAGNDGAGSGLDADLLDGREGAFYLPAGSYTAADVLAKLATVDGAGSGLDADLLDGWERDDLRNWNNLLARPGSFPAAPHTHSAADIAGAFPGSLSANGYTVLPSGLILQWVTGAQQGAGSEGSQYVTFPIAFNACFQVFASTQVANVNTESHATYQLVSFGNEGATVMRQLVSSAGSDREPSWPRLFAIGR